MKASRCFFLGAVAALVAAGSPALAVGPVDGEITALYWGSDTQIDATNEGSGAAGGRAELWFWDKVGASASRLAPSPTGTLDGSDLAYTNVDVKWRLLSASKNNFIAFGAGWEKFTADGLSTDSSDGVRVVAEGRVGIVRVLYFYARAAYLPSLSDLDTGVETLTDGKGHEGEAGLQLKPWPFMQFFLGYRENKTEFKSSAGDVTFDSTGPVAGFGFNF